MFLYGGRTAWEASMIRLSLLIASLLAAPPATAQVQDFSAKLKNYQIQMDTALATTRKDQKEWCSKYSGADLQNCNAEFALRIALMQEEIRLSVIYLTTLQANGTVASLKDREAMLKASDAASKQFAVILRHRPSSTGTAPER